MIAPLSDIREIIYPNGAEPLEERDCITLFDDISGVLVDAGLGPSTDSKDAQRVAEAIACLRNARALLVSAKCPKAADRVRLAITSALGAQRAASHRKYRDERKALRGVK